MPRWLLWTVLALLSWGVWAVLSKPGGESLAGVVPNEDAAFFSQALSTIGLLPVLAGLLLSRRLTAPGNRTRGIIAAAIGGTISALGNIAYYHALNMGGKVATVVPLTALYPLVTIALAVLFLREKLNAIQLAGVVLSMLAIYLFNIADPRGFFSSALVFAIIPMALWGCSGFLQKICTNHISGELSSLIYLSAFVPVAVFVLWRQPLDYRAISTRSWMILAALGFFLALGNWAILRAFASEGKASIIAPLSGLYPVISVPIAIVAFGEKIGAREIAGILLALLSVAALSAESKLAVEGKNEQEDLTAA